MTDEMLISRLGGSFAVAKKLGYSQQRVHNWIKRGIPAKEKLKHPELLMTDSPMARLNHATSNER